MMALPSPASNQKWQFAVEKPTRNCAKTLMISILFSLSVALGIRADQEPPVDDQEHEREELGVNRYTTPSIERIFEQLDRLRPLPFDQLKRELPRAAPATREQKALIFGGLIADGFLIVEAERRNLIEKFGRILMDQARALGVGDRVMRHSASLTELGKRGDWQKMHQELIATQSDVEQAMIELRDEKMAHLISLGGWLRGLEISSGAVEAEFSPLRAKILAQPDLADYFADELRTLPPATAHSVLFEKLRGGIKAMQPLLQKSPETITLSDIRVLHAEARELNDTIRQND